MILKIIIVLFSPIKRTVFVNYMDHGEGPHQEEIRLIARVRLDGEDLRVMVHLALLRFFPPYDFGTQCRSHDETLGPHVPASESQA